MSRAGAAWSWLLWLCLTLVHGAVHSQSLAVTFDDGPRLESTPLLSPQARNRALLDALARHHVQAALFVTVANGADRPAGLALARAWGEAGHVIGNHSMTHPDLHRPEVGLLAYQQELLDCDAVIRGLRGYRRWFRFTYLREGNTPEKRDGMRDFLAAQDYRNARVTLDTSDWRLDAKLREVLAARPDADLAPIRRVYLAHLRQRAQAYRELAHRLQGREVPQVMLLHHNLINALWLDDALGMFEAEGWSIVSPDTAYADPIHALQPALPAPGQSLLLSMARSPGIARFEGWQRLHDDGAHEIAELQRLGY